MSIATTAERMRSNQPTIGTWFSIGSPVIAEIAAASGISWALFDHEQGSAPESALPENLRALGGSSLVPVVRVGARHPDVIMRALNWGAEGIMIPHVESAADAKNCVDMIHYPPLGARGISRSIRAVGYGTRDVDFIKNPPRPLVLLQIESIEGVRNAEAIAAVDGVDMLFVGPADLSFDIGVRNDSSAPDFDECLRLTIAAAHAKGKSCGILVRDEADLPKLRQMGFDHFAIDSDMAILRRRYQHIAGILCDSLPQ